MKNVRNIQSGNENEANNDEKKKNNKRRRIDICVYDFLHCIIRKKADRRLNAHSLLKSNDIYKYIHYTLYTHPIAFTHSYIDSIRDMDISQ